MKVVLIPNQEKDRELKYTNLLVDLLKGYDVQIEIYFDREGSSPPPDADLYVVLGGDGSIMRASHNAAAKGIPILPINLGRIGYMAELEREELKLIGKFFSGDYTIEERMMLSVVAPDGREYIALNDAVLSNGRISKMVSLSLHNNQSFVSQYNSDGIIIATPTGSTAYSMSAGGPILDPLIECLVVTPVCPHSLSCRPIVFSGDAELEIINNTDREIPVFLTVDGGENLEIEYNQSVKIARSNLTTKLVRIKNEGFYRVLGKKMIQE